MRLPLLNFPPDPATSRPAGFDSGPRSIRAVRVLRISVTDRCNFRCVYCMPEEGVRWLEKDDLLSFEEVVEVARAAAEVHGIRRFKLTGGEPTVRRGLVDLVSMLRRSVEVEDLSLTTNGMLLEDLAAPLKHAGLDRLTVSIDSLRADRFRRITRTGDLSTVLRGLDRADAVGFGGLKVNCVTMRGVNDDEFADFARLTIQRPLSVRFIEYMPLGNAAVGGQCSTREVDESETGPAGGCGAQDRGDDVFVSETEVRRAVEAELGPLLPVERDSEPGVGPAIVYRLQQGNPLGRIGFISAMSSPFCSTCNRLRLTATGVLRSCLFEGGEVDLKPILRHRPRQHRDCQSLLADAMTECVRLKPDVHGARGNEQMSRIGG